MTHTVRELAAATAFWKRRCFEQMQYIACYRMSAHTRPDQEAVVASAQFILERCKANLAMVETHEKGGPHLL